MNEKEAAEILNGNDGNTVCLDDGSLYSIGWYLNWDPGNKDADLDGQFSADQLEAIAWWMRNKIKV
jgi:hypothetical protein